MDDPSAEIAISEPKVIYALKIFENELQQLKDENAKLGEVDRKFISTMFIATLTQPKPLFDSVNTLQTSSFTKSPSTRTRV
jgi:hypothetical protein